MSAIAFLVWTLAATGSPVQTPARPVNPPTPANVQPIVLDSNDLYAIVEMKRYPVPDTNGRLKASAQLESLVRGRLEKARFNVLSQVNEGVLKQGVVNRMALDPDTLRLQSTGAPLLRIVLNVLFLDTGSRVALYTQTSLIRPIRVVDTQSGGLLNASLWTGEPAMQSAPATRWEEEARKIVLQQVETFVAAARPPMTVESKTPAAPGAAPGIAFVAFRFSPEFHRPDCPVARTIKPENLVTYTTRDGAFAAGKRPCRSCNP
jgi:hypothetical protein